MILGVQLEIAVVPEIMAVLSFFVAYQSPAGCMVFCDIIWTFAAEAYNQDVNWSRI